MAWLFSLGLFLVLCVLLGLILPNPPPSRRRRDLQDRITRRLKRPRAWLHARLRTRLPARLRPPPVPVPDPFDTLRLQTRLTCLSSKIRTVESTPHIYARAHRLMALEAAYDDLLDEACRLAGVPTTPAQPHSEQKRWQEEQELSARGWTW
ncbi:hypothetical protein [Kribbella solani]|uniref:Uncharacterized protein n=1 Tax=Kribbella solani TaxID=236067 RepID=A0A841DPX9_9ACTN|nr:hypothetical protein [Kribbella solani]MBB5980713.1 hypothetical protein [Kribbella solani]